MRWQPTAPLSRSFSPPTSAITNRLPLSLLLPWITRIIQGVHRISLPFPSILYRLNGKVSSTGCLIGVGRIQCHIMVCTYLLLLLPVHSPCSCTIQYSLVPCLPSELILHQPVLTSPVVRPVSPSHKNPGSCPYSVTQGLPRWKEATDLAVQPPQATLRPWRRTIPRTTTPNIRRLSARIQAGSRGARGNKGWFMLG